MAAVPLTREDLHNGPGKEELHEELQNAERDDTVCKYCGVAYLVFSEIKELEKKLKATEARMKQWEHKAGQYDTVVAELRAAKQQVLAGTAALEEVSDERDSLARQLQELREDTQREKAEAEARWKRRLEDQQARAELERKRAVDAKGLEAQAMLTRQSLAGKGHLLRLREHKARAREMADVLMAQKQALRAMREEVTSQRGDITNLVGAVLNESGTIHRVVRRLRGEVSTLEAELEDARDTGASTAAKLTAAEARTAALEAEVAALKADSSSAEQSLRASLATVTATCAELEQERHALAEQLRAKGAEGDDASARAIKLQADLSAAQVEVMTARREAAAAKAALEDLRRQSAAEREKFDRLRKEAEKNARAAAEAAQRASGDASAREARLASDLDAARARVAELEQAARAASAAREAASDEAQRAFEAKLAAVREQMRQEKEDVNRQLTGALQQLKQERERLKGTQQQLDAARAAHAAAEGKASEGQRLQRLVQELQRELERVSGDHATKMEALKRQLHAKDEALREAEMESSTLVNQLLRAQAELKDCRVELETAKQQISEAATTTAKVTDLEGMERHLIKLSNQLRQKDTEISHLEATVHKECEEREFYMQKLQSLQASLGMVQEQARGHMGPPPRSTVRAPSPIQAQRGPGGGEASAPSGGGGGRPGGGDASSGFGGSAAPLSARSSASSASTTWSRRGRGGTNRGRRSGRRFR